MNRQALNVIVHHNLTSFCISMPLNMPGQQLQDIPHASTDATSSTHKRKEFVRGQLKNQVSTCVCTYKFIFGTRCIWLLSFERKPQIIKQAYMTIRESEHTMT